MRFIRDNQPPTELIRWHATQLDGPGANYDDHLKSPVKIAVRMQRLRQQGWLCAYTMQEVFEVHYAGELIPDAHIEHLTPRSVSMKQGRPDQTVDYRNMVACLPRNGGDTSLGYGAPVRRDLPLSVRPDDPKCEQRLRFSRNGQIKPVDSNDEGALETIKALKLDHPSLEEMRAAAVSGFGLSPLRADSRRSRFATLQTLISATAAQKLAAQITQFSGGKLTPFCVAVQHAAQDHAATVEKARQTRIFARRQPS